MDDCPRQDPAYRPATGRPRCGGAFLYADSHRRWTDPRGGAVRRGPAYDTKDSTLAITGGTGHSRNARGTMDPQARDGGAKFAFVFRAIG